MAAACNGRAPAASGLRTPRRRGAWDRYRLGHRPVRTSHAVGGAGSMYSQAAVSSASVAARAVLRWDGTPEKGGPGRPGLAGTFGGHCLWGCLSGSRVVRGSSSGASWRVGRGRFAGREASAVGGLLPARRRGLGACSSLPSGVAGAVCSVRLGLVRGASRRPWRRSFGWGGGGKGTSPGCAVGSCGGRTRPLVARVTRSVAIGAQRSQADISSSFEFFVSACFLHFSVFSVGGMSIHSNFSTSAAICAIGERGDNRNRVTGEECTLIHIRFGCGD